VPDNPKFGPGFKRAIVSLVERGGEVRSFYAERATVSIVTKIVSENVDRATRLNNARMAMGIDDAERADKARMGIVGKPLTYRTTSQRQQAAE
jgi:hypothetical protein